VFGETEIAGLLELPLFDVPVTPDSRRRRELYRQETQRQVAFDRGGTADYEAFLRASDIRLEMAPLGPDDITRIFELSQRTNQVNISGARYERAQVEALVGDAAGRVPIVLRCADRFGEYGVIGFVLFDPGSGTVEDYFMSCRVQRKYVEHALFQCLLDLAAESAHATLRVRYRRTERNQVALRLLEDLGFERQGDDIDAGWLQRGVEPIPGAHIVRVTQRPTTPTPSGAVA
jgi:FkbH-like protein